MMNRTITRHIDCIEGDLAGWEEARMDGHPAAGRMIAILQEELRKAQANQRAGIEGVYVPPGNWRKAFADEGAACYYDGEREIAAGVWQLDEDDPNLWRKLEQYARLP